MRSRVLILATLVGLAVVALVIGVAVAGAGQSDPLPEISAPDLLAKMAQADGVTAVSGEIAWQNGLFGDLSAANAMGHLPAQSPLTSSGSGRIWVSEAGAKVESQGSGGDQVVVVDKAARTAWVFDYAQNTVKRVVVTGQAPAGTPPPAPDATLMTPEMIGVYLQQVARFATVEVAGQTKVAGRDAYQLRMTPVATDTALGYVQAAVDGQTMLPLQLEVYAKGATAPVIKFGFTSVSYDAIDPATFAFTPPAGAKVTTKTVDGQALKAKAESMQQSHAAKGEDRRPPRRKRRSRPSRARCSRAARSPSWSRTSSPGRATTPHGRSSGATCSVSAGPLTGVRRPLLKALDGVAGMDLSAATGMDLDGLTTGPHSDVRAPRRRARPASCSTARASARSSWLRRRPRPSSQEQLKQARQASEILGSTTVNGAKALVVGTPLGGIVVWQQGDTTLIAGGMVPMSDLETFAGSVR